MDAQRLLDLEAIRSLQVMYCIWVDQKRWLELRTLFADDAVLEMNNREERPSTPNGIADYIAEVIGSSNYSHHCTASIVTFVDDDHAHATWSLFYAIEGEPQISYGFYEDDVARIDGEWKISTMRRIRRFTQP